MNRSLRHLIATALVASLVLLVACGGKKTKVATEQAREGRDRELLGEGITELQGGHYERSRLLFNTLINTYPDSGLLPVTKLALADSYYRAGSFADMNDSEVQYKDWLQFFPKHPLADDVMLKIAEVHLRQVQAADRDTTHARLAERQLVKLLADYPDSDLKERATQLLWEVREILGMHELKVGRFYYTHRAAYKAAADRMQEIIDKYPGFSRTDEALYLAGVSQVELEDTEKAIDLFTRLCKYYPQSAYFGDASAYLKKLDAAVPEPAAEGEQPHPKGEQPGFIGSIVENISHPRIENVSKDGVLFKKEDAPGAALEKALAFSSEQTSASASVTK